MTAHPKGAALAREAGIRCGEETFHRFLRERFSIGVRSDDEAAQAVRYLCGPRHHLTGRTALASRALLDHDAEAGARWRYIAAKFRDWKGRQP